MGLVLLTFLNCYMSTLRLVHYALLLTLLNPIIFQSLTENLPLLTLFPPQLISIPSFCYSQSVCVCVRACVRACVRREVFLVQMFAVLEHNYSSEINICITQPILKRRCFHLQRRVHLKMATWSTDKAGRASDPWIGQCSVGRTLVTSVSVTEGPWPF